MQANGDLSLHAQALVDLQRLLQQCLGLRVARLVVGHIAQDIQANGDSSLPAQALVNLQRLLEQRLGLRVERQSKTGIASEISRGRLIFFVLNLFCQFMHLTKQFLGFYGMRIGITHIPQLLHHLQHTPSFNVTIR